MVYLVVYGSDDSDDDDDDGRIVLLVGFFSFLVVVVVVVFFFADFWVSTKIRMKKKKISPNNVNKFLLLLHSGMNE